MYSLVLFYLHQAGRGKNDVIGPVYAIPLFLQRGYGFGSFLARLWRAVRPVYWSGARTLGPETLRNGGNILTNIARSTDGGNPRDILSRHVNETTQNLIGRLRGRGLKRKVVVERKQKSGRNRGLQKDIFSKTATF